MLLLFLAITLTDAQQAKHDTKWAIYQVMQSDEATIADIWRPSAKLLLDYRKLRKCYVQFHLYRTKECNAEPLVSTSISAKEQLRASRSNKLKIDWGRDRRVCCEESVFVLRKQVSGQIGCDL